MRGSKKKRNIIIISLVGILLCMVVGYSAFQTKLEIKGTSKVTSNWDIEITNVTEGTPSGFAIILSNSTMTMTNGSITNNSGQAGAVNVYNNSKFTMSGGSITNNTASWQGGGVARDSGSTFTQTGGTISGNKPNNTYVL